MPLISLAEAVERCQRSLAPAAVVERVGLNEAADRVLAQEIIAPLDVPSFARATMDGYAVMSAETAGASRSFPKVLRCVEFIHAGSAVGRTIGAGACVEIATGAMLPAGADAVVMVEATKRAEADVFVFQPVVPGQHVATRGSDIEKGSFLFPAGAVINPSRLATLAGVGLTAVTVYVRPRVAVISSGTELREPGDTLEPGQIYNMNAPALTALVLTHGCMAETMPIVPDDNDALLGAIRRAARCDLVLLSGGSSVGRKDLLVQLARREGEVLFHGIALKPGRPTLLTRLAGALVLGLPGNPTSCLVVAQLLVVPLLRRLAHLPPHEPPIRRVRLSRPIVSPRGLHHVVTVRIEGGLATPVFKESGDITSLSLADGYVEVPAEVERVEAAEPVEVKGI